MAVPYETLEDQNASQNTAAQGTCGKMSIYKIVIGIVCVLCLISIIAMIVILARIYVNRKIHEAAVDQTNLAHFFLIYGTNMTNGSSLMVGNITVLDTNLMKTLELQKISIESARLVQSSGNSTVPKSQALQNDNDQCETDPGITGDRLIVSLTIKYPQECNSSLCKQNYITNVTYRINSLHRNITLPVKFTNGSLLNISMSFCSLIPTPGNNCSSTQCLNGGICINPNVCICTPQWNGSNCATPVCSSKCLNNGTCSAPDTCICPSGWNGSTCATPVCSPICQNGGNCSAVNVCTCKSGYSGLYCQIGSTCFYGQDKVNLIDGGQRSIENLKVGDRIWSISADGNSFIEDEILLMMHNGLNKTALFYTFKTVEGDEVSLTSAHNIPVFIPEENKIKFTRASKVTLKHRLIMFGRKIEIVNISINTRQGFYAPLTFTGYLFVNNISTSVFSDSYRVSPNILQRAFTPFRIYYRLIRWCFGNNYDPFETDMKEGLHPLPAFFIQHQFKIRNIYYVINYSIPTLFIASFLHFISKFSYGNIKKDD